MVAANQGHTSVVHTLLAYGTDTQIPDRDARQLLTIAAKQRYTAIVQLLQAEGKK